MAKAVQLKDMNGNKCYAVPWFPIGFVYLSFTDVNPSTYFGGTWEKISSGFLYGADSNTAVGSGNGTGTWTNSHSLSVEQLPSHHHGLNGHTHSIPSLSGTAAYKSLTGNLNSMYGSIGVSPLRDNCRVDGVFSRNGTTTVNTPGYTAVKGYGLHIDASHSHSVSTNSSTTGGNSGNTTNTGSGKGHSHNIPYIAVYMWRRTK